MALWARKGPGAFEKQAPVLLMTTLVKPCLQCDLNFAMETSCKQLYLLATVSTFGITQLDFSLLFKLL